ncbi:MAG: capsule assembly Wzi family protein [Chloroherpetonaceae bacterium]|nr:capsule assembly Wzi family protein [Chloroherpetonaceae bacterium]
MKIPVSLKLILLLALLYSPISLKASGETFPAGHWAYDVIEQLIVRGYLPKLADAAKPFERVDVAKALIATDKSLIEDRVTLWLFNKLEQELENEIEWLRDGVFPVSGIRLGLRPELITEQREDDYAWRESTPNVAENLAFGARVRNRLRAAFHFEKDWVAYSSMIIQQEGAFDLVRARTYGGKQAYFEQGFIAYHGDLFRVKFGRDYLNWGYGRRSLVISNTAGPIDHLLLQLNTQTIRVTYFAAQLDKFQIMSDQLLPLGSDTALVQSFVERYMVGTRVDLNLIANSVRLGIWQTVIFDGKNRSADFRNFNPMMIFYGTQSNDNQETNPSIGADFSIYLAKEVNLYGSLMIDDWQVDNASLVDLEPNAWAGQLGLRVANVLKSFDVNGTDAFLELTTAMNRTYHQRSAFQFQRFVFGDNPIAHPLGTDFQSLEIGFSHWLFKFLRFSGNWLQVNKGEGNLFGPYTTPWLDRNPDGTPKYSLASGYSEPTPYFREGISAVEKRTALSFGVFYQPSSTFNVELNLTHIWRTNADNVIGKEKTDLQIFGRIQLELQPFLNLF